MDSGTLLMVVMGVIFVSVPIIIVLQRIFRRCCGCETKDPQRRRARLYAYLFYTTRWGVGLDLFQVVLSLFACGCYVYETYDADIAKEGWWETLELSVGVIFGIDYLFRFYIAKNRLAYYFTPLALIDFITVLPTLVYAALLVEDGDNVAFLRVLRLLRALRVLRVIKIMRLFQGEGGGGSTSVLRAVARVAFTALCLIFSCACFFALVEDIPFHVAFYFMCIEALGRPPIPILTIPGFFLVYGLVVLSVILLPKQVADLISTWAIDKSKRKAFTKDPNDDHIQLCGFINYSTTKNFLADVFQEAASLTRICIVSAQQPSPHLSNMLTLPPFADYTKFCQGSVLDAQDLLRVMAPSAKEIFVFSQVHCKAKQLEDHVTCTRVISLKHYCPNSRIRVMVLLPKTMDVITSLSSWRKSVDVVVCLEELKMSMMVANCVVWGTFTLLTTLFSASLSQFKLLPEKTAQLPLWQQDYLKGRANSTYTIKLPSTVTGLTFHWAASYLYAYEDVLLIGVEGSEGRVLLNPGKEYQIQEEDTGVVVCKGMRKLDTLSDNSELFDTILKESGHAQALERLSATEIHNKNSSQDNELGSAHTAVPFQSPRGQRDVQAPKMTNLDTASAANTTKSGLIIASGTSKAELARAVLYDYYEGDVEAMLQDVHAKEKSQQVSSPGNLGSQRNVLICGFIIDLRLCVQPLVQAGFHVTILASNVSLTDQQNFLQGFGEAVTFVEGSCEKLEDLERAGLQQASSAIVLAKDKYIEVTGMANIDELVQDTDALLVHKLIKSHAPHVFVTTELVDSSHIVFMEDDGASDEMIEDAESILSCRSFASGQVYSAMLVSILMSKLHVLPCALTLLKDLISTSAPDASAAHVRSILPPSDYFGKQYSELLLYLVENHQIVLLGLRRQYEGDRQKVILANPEPDMLICPEDELYVLYPADTANTCTTPDARDVAPTDATIVANVDRDVISAISPLQQF